MGGRGSGGGGGGFASAVSAKMPTLQGSEKQVIWAKEIRAQALEALDAHVRNASGKYYRPGFSNPTLESFQEVRRTVVNMFQQQTSAKTFIDNRNNFSFERFKKMALALDQKKK